MSMLVMDDSPDSPKDGQKTFGDKRQILAWLIVSALPAAIANVGNSVHGTRSIARGCRHGAACGRRSVIRAATVASGRREREQLSVLPHVSLRVDRWLDVCPRSTLEPLLPSHQFAGRLF